MLAEGRRGRPADRAGCLARPVTARRDEQGRGNHPERKERALTTPRWGPVFDQPPGVDRRSPSVWWAGRPAVGQGSRSGDLDPARANTPERKERAVTMSNSPVPAQRPDYGIDAPGVVRNLFLVGLAGLLFWGSSA